MRIRIAWEPLDDLLTDGLEDLAIGHWDETENDHVPLALDIAEARRRERAGTFKIVGVRNAAALVGYAYFLIGSSLQHKGTLQAWCEGIYVMPEARGAGGLLLRALPDMLAALGVKRAFMAAKPHVLLRSGDEQATFSDLLVAAGWPVFETIHARSLRVDDERGI